MTRKEALQKIDELKDYIKELDKKSPIEKAHDEFGHFCFGGDFSYVSGDYIIVPLPTANKRWTYDVWDYVRRFCEEYPAAYPIFEAYGDNDGYFDGKAVNIYCGYLQ